MASQCKEISIPTADPNDPYAIPAAMPSSADRAPRSFDVADFAIPTRKQDDWRFTPVERMEEFFEVFQPAGKLAVEVSNIDGSSIDSDDVSVETVAMGQAPSGTIAKPNDRVSAVEWNSASSTLVVHVLRDLHQPVLIRIVGEGASLRHSVVTLGGDVVRIRMDQDFGGEQGDLNMLGIYFVDPGEHIEHRTMVVHNHPECKSRVVYKGALDGKDAHSTWVGNALIEPTAPGTDSYELNRNLVLTPGAIADSEPNLEIENGNIVGAGHASSVGRFDDEELFYLQSRGISEVEARKLVVRGFFGELVEEIGIESIAQHLMNVIDRRLAKGEDKAAQVVVEEN